MCGVGGVVLTDSHEWKLAESFWIESLESLAHRGRDGSGVWSDDGVVLVHTRLAIIDLSENGHQPMLGCQGRYVSVCNGEIYNYRELKARLVALGHQFHSANDNEVIPHLFEEFGINAIPLLRGMFAVAIWDRQRDELFLARDRLGEKPLYFVSSPTRLFFASEAPALQRVPGVQAALDEVLIGDWLTYPHIPAPRSAFRQISSLEPATVLSWRKGEVKKWTYWRLNFRASRRKGVRLSTATREVGDLLWSAVREQSGADVPLGVALSGGVDSSLIALAAKDQGLTLEAFALGYGTDFASDPELIRAREVARKLDLFLREEPFVPAQLSALPEIIARYGEPMTSFTALYAHTFARTMSTHVKVLLSGNGADEIFLGYSGYERGRGLLPTVGMTKLMPKGLLQGGFSSRSRLGEFETRARELGSLPVEEWRGRNLRRHLEHSSNLLFEPSFAAKVVAAESWKSVDSYAQECNPRDYLDTVMYTDLMVYHQHGLTVIPDISGMSHSLEIRAPFLDYRLIELAAGLPRRYTVPTPGTPRLNKFILKRLLAGRLGIDIAFARKQGFGFAIPMSELVLNHWSPVVRRFVLLGAIREAVPWKEKELSYVIQTDAALTWMLLTLAVWFEIFVEGHPPASLRDEIDGLLAKSSPNG